MKNINKYFKAPFYTDDYYMYIFDSNNQVMFNILDNNKQKINMIIDCLNDKSEYKFANVSINGENIDIDNKPILCVRGFGYLTGAGALGLSNEDAIKIQNDMLEFVIIKLTKYYFYLK